MATGWVCLMYHDVTDGAPRAGGGPERFTVSRRAFERQLDCILARGGRGLSIASMAERADGDVAISFDDGEAGLYACAFPALVTRGMTATFFVVTDWIGRAGYLTWSQLREMKAAGMSIQSHTCSHAFLSELDAPALWWELRESRRRLDAELDQDTDEIALPGGDEPRPLLAHLIREAGYRVVATSHWGVNEGRLRRSEVGFVSVRRCWIRGEPSPDRISQVLRGSGWVAHWQGVRGAALRRLRSGLGPSRYAALRRSILDSVAALR